MNLKYFFLSCIGCALLLSSMGFADSDKADSDKGKKKKEKPAPKPSKPWFPYPIRPAPSGLK